MDDPAWINQSVRIPKLEAGSDRPFVFYILNRSDKTAFVRLPNLVRGQITGQDDHNIKLKDVSNSAQSNMFILNPFFDSKPPGPSLQQSPGGGGGISDFATVQVTRATLHWDRLPLHSVRKSRFRIRTDTVVTRPVQLLLTFDREIIDSTAEFENTGGAMPDFREINQKRLTIKSNGEVGPEVPLIVTVESAESAQLQSMTK